MAGILRLETNVPETIALRFATPKLQPSSMEGRPDDWMYSLADGRITYLPGKAKAAIDAAGVGANQQFELCKRKVGREIEYQVRILAAGTVAPAPTAQSTPAANDTTTSGHQHSNGTNAQPYTGNVPVMPARAQTPPQPVVAAFEAHPAPHRPTSESRIMSSLYVAVRAAIAAREFARQNGLDVEPTFEDVRTLAATVFIDEQKGGR